VTAADFDADIGWKSAKKTAGACSAADITQLQANFSNAAITTYLDLGKNVSTSCKACAISYDTDANWQPIVATFADGGATGFVNFGACFGAVEGAACGKALQYEEFCYGLACNDCAVTATQHDQCVNVAGNVGGMCNTFANTRGTSCPNVATTITTCANALDSIKYLCQ
jgi:hypothetical protein